MTWSERELEDFVCENENCLGLENFAVLDRQVQLPNGGIIDILGVNTATGGLYVVELKAVTATGKALSQVLSYANVVSRSRIHATLRMVVNVDEVTWGYWSAPMAVIVAPAFSDRLLLAADYVGVELRFIDRTWTVKYVNHEHTGNMAAGAHPEKLAMSFAVQARVARDALRRKPNEVIADDE